MKLDLKKNNSFTRTLNVIMSWDDVKDDYQKEFNRIKSNYTPQEEEKAWYLVLLLYYSKRIILQALRPNL